MRKGSLFVRNRWLVCWNHHGLIEMEWGRKVFISYPKLACCLRVLLVSFPQCWLVHRCLSRFFSLTRIFAQTAHSKQTRSHLIWVESSLPFIILRTTETKTTKNACYKTEFLPNMIQQNVLAKRSIVRMCYAFVFVCVCECDTWTQWIKWTLKQLCCNLKIE